MIVEYSFLFPIIKNLQRYARVIVENKMAPFSGYSVKAVGITTYFAAYV